MATIPASGRRSQAVLILAHRNFDWVLELIRRLDHPNIGIYIHVDRKVNQAEVQEFSNACKPLSGVNFVTTRYRLNWAGRHHLIASLHLARRALIDRPTNVHLITGQDYPIKSARNISVHGASEQIYLDHFPLPSEKWSGNGGLDRVQQYHPYDHINVRTRYGKPVISLARKAHKRVAVQRALPELRLFGGSSYWSLPRDAMTYLLDYLDEHPSFLKRFRHTFCSDEMVPHTIILNSYLADRVVNDDLRFIVWGRRGSSIGSPAILNEGDTSKILASEDIFARKISHPQSTKLIARLDLEVHGQEGLPQVP